MPYFSISAALRYWPERPHFEHFSRTMAAGYSARLNHPSACDRGCAKLCQLFGELLADDGKGIGKVSSYDTLQTKITLKGSNLMFSRLSVFYPNLDFTSGAREFPNWLS